jgi:hypothetical protein
MVKIRLIVLFMILGYMKAPSSGLSISFYNDTDYYTYINAKLNRILGIPKGRNYWEKEYQTKPYEDKLKKYLEENY